MFFLRFGSAFIHHAIRYFIALYGIYTFYAWTTPGLVESVAVISANATTLACAFGLASAFHDIIKDITDAS